MLDMLPANILTVNAAAKGGFTQEYTIDSTGFNISISFWNGGEANV